jgi:hypothetical protein
MSQQRWRAGIKIALAGILSLVLVGGAAAQNRAWVAFVNASGQLIVSSADGGYRWIVTNPGEYLVEPIGFTWSPNGAQLFFAVSTGGGANARIADVGSQTVLDLGVIGASSLSGGAWTADGQGVLAADSASGTLHYGGTNGTAVVFSGQNGVSLFSTYADTRPYLPSAAGRRTLCGRGIGWQFRRAAAGQ